MAYWDDYRNEYDSDFDEEPEQVFCDHCGEEITFTNIGDKWVPTDVKTLKPHECDFSALLEATK